MSKTLEELLEEAKAEVPMISCEEYKKAEDAGNAPLLLDVREKEEWDEGHIEGATHVPRGFLEFQIEEKVPDKEAEMAICCGSGKRALLSGRALKQLGYENVRVLEGGYSGYCEEQAKS